MRRQIRQTVSWRLAMGLFACGFFLSGPAPVLAAPRIIEVSPEQLTQEAKHQFPQRRCAGGIACVTLSDPKVRIIEGQDRLMLSAQALPALGGQEFSAGLIEVGALPEYRNDEGAFFLKDSALTRLEFPGLDPLAASTILDLIKPLIAEALATTPVWALDDSDPQQAMLRIVLQKVEVVGGRLRLTIGR